MINSICQTVIFLFTSENSKKSPIPLGTGFLIGYPVSEDKKTFIPFIVTAKHVLGDHKIIYGRFNTQVGSKTAMVEYDIEDIKKNNDYWEHIDKGVDIAIFRTYHFNETLYQTIPINLIAGKNDFENEKIQQTDRVIFPGLLVNFMGETKNFPIMKDGSIALIPSEPVSFYYKIGQQKINTSQELIFVNAIAIPGMSGSPVFLYPGMRLKGKSFSLGGGKFYLIGLIHGFYHAAPREVFKVETTETKLFYEDNSGIALVFPSWRIKEIIERDDFKKRINELITN